MEAHNAILKRAYKNDIICYTDGSFKNGFGGVGICIVQSNPIRIERFGASLYNSSPLLSELVAIELCLLRIIAIQPQQDQYVHIFCDSLGAIQCLKLITKSNSHLIACANEFLPVTFILRLQKVISYCFFSLRFHHIKSHSGILGNEQADKIAKMYRRDSEFIEKNKINLN